MRDMKDAPEIRQAEKWGAPRAEEEPRCPVCGAACEWLYLYRGCDPVGCDRCLTRTDAWEKGAEDGNCDD